MLDDFDPSPSAICAVLQLQHKGLLRNVKAWLSQESVWLSIACCAAAGGVSSFAQQGSAAEQRNNTTKSGIAASDPIVNHTQASTALCDLYPWSP